MTTRPIVNIADVPLRDGGNGKQFAAKLGRIGGLIGSQKLGCQLHVVAVGQKAFPRHAHHVNEEMFFILMGEGTYRVGEETYPIREGDVISAPPGDATTAHQIVNTGAGELRCRALIVGDCYVGGVGQPLRSNEDFEGRSDGR